MQEQNMTSILLFIHGHSFSKWWEIKSRTYRLMAKKLSYFSLFIYLGFYVAFNTVQVISQWIVGRAEETSTYSSLVFCTVNCPPTASNYQLSHLRLCGNRTPASEVPPWPRPMLENNGLSLRCPKGTKSTI